MKLGASAGSIQRSKSLHPREGKPEETYEMQVQSLGQETALEEGMATHSRILAWKDRGAWWAMVHRVTQSQTSLKRLRAERLLDC